eukprot:TRINITY_DN2316_c0_g1_i4.p1 TRINITY_DN2316_c0_g1~~TRINITY_DN2316_c0_g1_i4.p1  ORF type:complete len:271 (-),score=65.02 TRINITY_DN2316_c0_g1_i4:73-885(-)
MAFVYPPVSDSQSEVPSYKSGWKVHLWASFKALCSLFFQNCVWVGGYNLLEDYYEATPWREMTYVATGMYLFVATNTFVPNSWIVVSESGDREVITGLTLEGFDKEEFQKHLDLSQHAEESFDPTVMFYGKAVLALCAQVMNNTGIWVLMDQYWFEYSDSRNIGYAVVGLALLWLSGALSINACVTPLITPMWETPELPTVEDVAMLAAAAQMDDQNGVIDASSLENAKELLPSARGRFRRRRHTVNLTQLSTWIEESHKNLLALLEEEQ